jgi:hypothetical protein
MKKRITYILAGIALTLSSAIPTYAVTKEEMEEARTIAAIVYLRNANNGSDYLDNVSAKSLSELEGKLKDTEKKNLATFKSVGLPSDYASWDKAKLVEYWSSTFYSNSEIKKIQSVGFARNTTKRRIEAMNIAAPSAAAAESPADETTPEAATEETTDETATNLESPIMEETVSDTEAQLKAQEDSIANLNKGVDSDSVIGEQSHTWLYIIILIILVAAMAALIVYASKVFKRQNDDYERTKLDKATDSYDREAAEREKEAMQAQIEELKRTANDCRTHLTNVKKELETERQRNEELQTRTSDKPVRRDTEAPQVISTTQDAPANMIRRRAPQPQPATERSEARREGRVIYLGRANSSGMFVRAEKEINKDKTVFRLVSKDGITGTFAVVDDYEVQDRILDDPENELGNACFCDDFDNTDRTEIITERNGTAIFESGRWRVLRKAHITLE